MLTDQQGTIILIGAIAEVRGKLSIISGSGSGELIVDGSTHTQLIDDALQSIGKRDSASAYRAADSGLKILESKSGAYSSWSYATRSQAGFLVAFYYVVQALAEHFAGRDAAARPKIAQALAIQECTGKLREMAQWLADDVSDRRIKLRKYVNETNENLPNKDYNGVIISATLGIELIEREQVDTPDWAGNDLAHLYAVRGQAKGALGLQRNVKSYIREGIADMDKALSFPSSYYINPKFREDVQERRNALKEHASGCFIATAAYGTALAPEIDHLRHFRDQKLLTHSLGRMLIFLYEHVSPPVANVISTRPYLQHVVRRWIVEPAVGWISR